MRQSQDDTVVSKDGRLRNFVAWVGAHLKGDEKGEAQIFLDHLFAAFGWPGLREAGASCEVRVKNDNGGTSFADLVWKPIVLLEMKRRGANLAKHYRQAFDYWVRLVPARPRYAVLCNFDEFWIYDFESVLDAPVETVKLEELPKRYGPLNFLFPGDVPPVFGSHQEVVTRQAADKLAGCFNSMMKRGVARELSQRFILQILMSLFAEDIGLLDRYQVTRLLQESSTPQDSYDLLGGLFEAMNSKEGVGGGRYKGTPYFNGGLFAIPARVELISDEQEMLREASKFDWSKVRPEIFGTLFEHSLDAVQRRAFGAHFTSPVDIMKIVGPTIVEPWRERIEAAGTLGRLRELLARIENFRVLDPACGSGNFLYIAYREVKRLEARIYERMAEDYKSVDARQRTFGFVTASNFFGIDINPFAVELAKVTMMLAHKLAIDELLITERALPLDNLDSNFRAGDALITAEGTRAPWFKADVIIGNPPFGGAKQLKREHSSSYINAVREAYPGVPGMADFCVYWFRRAHDELTLCDANDPFRGRAGLVGTQNVRNTASRVGGLDYIVDSGAIVEAVENQPWSGQANVHVSIVNWVKSQDATLLPKKRYLWREVVKEGVARTARKKRSETRLPGKDYELDIREVAYITASLSDEVDTSRAIRLECNRRPQRAYQGVTPGYDGFVIEPEQAEALLAGEPQARELVKPYLIGRELNSGDGRPQRFLIDAYGLDLSQLAHYPRTLALLRERVLPKVKEKLAKERERNSDMVTAREEHLERWWTFWAQRIELRKWLAGHTRIIAASRTQRTPFLFNFVSCEFALGDKLQLFAFDDDYSFGVLQSAAHCAWYAAKGARLKNEVDFNYSSEEVFGTFPWPQAPTEAQVAAVGAAAREVLAVRGKALSGGTGIRALYSTLSLPGKNELRDAHNALDAAVSAAYQFASERSAVEQLLELNGAVARAMERGRSPMAPGIPAGYSARKVRDLYASVGLGVV